MVAVVDPEQCEGCAVCVDACPTDAITMNESDKAVVDEETCSDCGECVDACPTNAISMK